MRTYIASIFIIIIVFVIVSYAFYKPVFTTLSSLPSIAITKLTNDRKQNQDIYASRYGGEVLDGLWRSYKQDFMQNDGRSYDASRDYLTTSEGQSYALLRAVWMDDKEMFDATYTWTINNLKKRPTDNLFAWKWEKLQDGSWGISSDNGGLNTASDADQDIALALIFANKRWNDNFYNKQAQKILNDIWNVDVVQIKGRPYMTAGSWAAVEPSPTLNPSYLSPAYYPIFAQVDPSHDWNALKDTSYEVLNKSTTIILPDWVSIDRQTSDITPAQIDDTSPGFSLDASRVPWRVGLDYIWNKDPRAIDYLKKLSFFQQQFASNNSIYVKYDLSGKPLISSDSISMYGGVLPYFVLVHPNLAPKVYEKIIDHFNPDIETFSQDPGYYSQNWGWFGIAFYQNKLPNIYSLAEVAHDGKRQASL